MTQNKEYNTKPTIKQKEAVKNIMENAGNVSKSMIQAGYSKATAKNPMELTESKGFKILTKELGLTDNLLITSLVDDIKGKPKDRSKELTLGFKVLGRLKEDNSNSVIPINLEDKDFIQIITAYKSRSNSNDIAGIKWNNSATSEEQE